MRPKPINPKPKFPSMMEYNGPKRTGKSPLEEGLDFIFSPFTALSGIVNQNAPIKSGGKYRVPQDMMKGTPKRKNPVNARPLKPIKGKPAAPRRGGK
jgi:hypothetical protein